ncbi:hypothetical protein OG883_01520 [Streptomyces sp. NBC_01142]|uniref:hypothetical protein n=1 Tax=Streptomyces sp. NBC_01142 TaxID=2975865 RepID=UPI0022593BF5|nr:hypothetical protein [Streptomyces sp. NBC_01142]MCX4818606.1 hypothetical protein [Streptomyces sp. NBC_01142]
MSTRLSTRRSRPSRSRPTAVPAPSRALSVVVAVVAATLAAVLIVLGASWLFGETSGSSSTPPTARDMSARVERSAAGLARSPLYTDPETEPLTAAEHSALLRRVEGLRAPLYVVAVPMSFADESGGDQALFAESLHRSLGRDGLYVIADAVRGDIELFNYGARLDDGHLSAVPASIAESDDPTELALAKRLDRLVSYVSKTPPGPAGSPAEPGTADDPAEEDALPPLFSEKTVPGVLAGLLGAAVLAALSISALVWGRLYRYGATPPEGRTRRVSRSTPAGPPTLRGTLFRRTACGAACVIGTVLVSLPAASPEWFGLSSSPPLFEAIAEQDRGVEAFIFGWLLVTIPAAGLLQTPVARYRRARVGAGWALIAAYWLVVLLLALAAWKIQGFFPAHGGRGKSGGIFGAAIALTLGWPTALICSGGVFLKVRAGGASLSDQVRGQLTTVLMIMFAFIGGFAAMLLGAGLVLPRDGAAMMFIPGLVWGGFLGLALAVLLAALLHFGPDGTARRAATLRSAASLARFGGLLLGISLTLAQLGWILPFWVMAILSFPAFFGSLVYAARHERLRHWLDFTLPELSKEPLE